MRSCQQPPPHRLRHAPAVLATGEPRAPAGEIQAPRSEVSKEKEEDHRDVAPWSVFELSWMVNKEPPKKTREKPNGSYLFIGKNNIKSSDTCGTFRGRPSEWEHFIHGDDPDDFGSDWEVGCNPSQLICS